LRFVAGHGHPLTLALVKTFRTMLAAKLESVHPKAVARFPGEHLLGTIEFSGKAEGRVFLRLSQDGAKRVAAGVMGLKPEEITDASEVSDAIGELLNIITGNFKSNLCDAGLDCRLQPPTVTRCNSFDVPTIPGGGLERMAFRAPQIVLFVDVSVNPWNED
jgi:chemotaxis protein CheX